MPSLPSLTQVSRNRIFDGWQLVYQHDSDVLNCSMKFGVYLPPQAESNPCPVLYWLSGLTCTEQNFITKAGAQQYAAQHGIILIAPDTSPRGCNLPGEDDSWDFGSGAGFYLNATQEPWVKHYRMYDYIVNELPALAQANLPISDRQSIFGHSMGGFGAIAIALKNPGRFKSCSAFAPIVTPCDVPWGLKAFRNYLGEDKENWLVYDPMTLIQTVTQPLPLMIDQGDADSFLGEQLQPDRFAAAVNAAGYPITLRMQPGYDHSYYFIASFIGDHIAYHAMALKT